MSVCLDNELNSQAKNWVKGGLVEMCARLPEKLGSSLLALRGRHSRQRLLNDILCYRSSHPNARKRHQLRTSTRLVYGFRYQKSDREPHYVVRLFFLGSSPSTNAQMRDTIFCCGAPNKQACTSLDKGRRSGGQQPYDLRRSLLQVS